MECVCSYCECSFGNANDHWQTVTVTGLDPGTYAVTTTSDDPIEMPCCTFTDTVTLEFPPTPSPTAGVTADPTAEPTSDPSAAPSRAPTVDPTASPTVEPTASPTYSLSVSLKLV